MKETIKNIGIWGFGVVGKSALAYFAQQENLRITIMDTRTLNNQEQEEIKRYNAHFIQQGSQHNFFEDNDIIITSPGIDKSSYHQYNHKFISELDIFAQSTKKKIVAITGTIGKTSITTLLSTIFQKNEPTLTGGNIGTAMLDLLKPSHAQTVILEVSSFQLEQCKTFAPDLAIWTNFYPNHLDRHKTVEEYFNAKYRLLSYQKEHQKALVPLELAPAIIHRNFHTIEKKGTLHFFTFQKPCSHTCENLPEKSTLFWIENDALLHYENKTIKELIYLKNFPDCTFQTNWLIISAALHLLSFPLHAITIENKELLEHRMEKIISPSTVEIYNDSKSTIMESTVAALDKLKGKKIILLLGGLSKGVLRKDAVMKLCNKVKYLICFGKEAQQLYDYAQSVFIPSSAHANLDDAVQEAFNKAHEHDVILFSPGGSSYDLFKNYEERGTYFKKLIQEYTNFTRN